MPENRDVEVKISRVDAECIRRIQTEFPLQKQILLLSALLFETAGVGGSSEISGAHSADYYLARNRDDARRFLQFALAHEVSANLLKQRIKENPVEAKSIDVTGPAWWPKREDFFNGR